MKKNMQIVKILSGNITAFDGDSYYLCDLRGNLKKNNKICVGDFVEFEKNPGDKERIVVTKILERKNQLIRPTISNIDNLLITITKKPSPDLNLVDALIIYCRQMEIEPIIVISKMDLVDDAFVRDIKEQYGQVVDNIIPICSLKNENLETLKKILVGRLSALAGQSAVGKSSLINAIFKDETKTETGTLSAKIERGKQTTRLVSLYKVGNGYLADTAGFSLLDLSFVSNLDKGELASYYPDFLKGREGCKYRSCLHEGGDCGVIKLVRDGKISKRRYENYLKILQEMKNSKKY